MTPPRSTKMARTAMQLLVGSLPGGSLPRYLLFRAVFLLDDLLRDFVVDFPAFLAVDFFFVADFLVAAFLAAPLRATFLAAGAWRLRAGARRLGASAISGSRRSAGIGVFGICVSPGRPASPTIAGAMTGSLMASSHPGVNISRRSREMAFARPQRGQCAS